MIAFLPPMSIPSKKTLEKNNTNPPISHLRWSCVSLRSTPDPTGNIPAAPPVHPSVVPLKPTPQNRKQKVPNTYDSEPIPPTVRAEIDYLLHSGDLYRYTAPKNSSVSKLEVDFASWIGSKYALAVSSCSAALFLSLKALNLAEGARVLIPAFTFAAVPSAVVHANCVPVLCEVGDDYRLDMAEFEDMILNGNISCVMVSHMRGHTSDMDIIMRLCDEFSIPVLEDAAHSLGTTWSGTKIGTIGRVGCFSFQSYKLLNAGEGGIMVTDDIDLMARAVIMSGAYEHMWRKHPVLHEPFAKYQNTLPVYNMRINNLSAAVIRAQIGAIDRRVRDGRANHDYVAGVLEESPWIVVPRKMEPEERAPDSIQFNLTGVSLEQSAAFQLVALKKGLKVEIFGLSKDNARAFWNWGFLPEKREMPKTRSMLMKACDMRLPARLTHDELDIIADVVLSSLHQVMGVLA